MFTSHSSICLMGFIPISISELYKEQHLLFLPRLVWQEFWEQGPPLTLMTLIANFSTGRSAACFNGKIPANSKHTWSVVIRIWSCLPQDLIRMAKCAIFTGHGPTEKNCIEFVDQCAERLFFTLNIGRFDSLHNAHRTYTAVDVIFNWGLIGCQEQHQSTKSSEIFYRLDRSTCFHNYTVHDCTFILEADLGCTMGLVGVL